MLLSFLHGYFIWGFWFLLCCCIHLTLWSITQQPTSIGALGKTLWEILWMIRLRFQRPKNVGEESIGQDLCWPWTFKVYPIEYRMVCVRNYISENLKFSFHNVSTSIALRRFQCCGRNVFSHPKIPMEAEKSSVFMTQSIRSRSLKSHLIKGKICDSQKLISIWIDRNFLSPLFGGNSCGDEGKDLRQQLNECCDVCFYALTFFCLLFLQNT